MCLAVIFEPLRLGVTTPELVLCPDGHWRWAIYGLGPYIADYPKQVWLTRIVQDWCSKWVLIHWSHRWYCLTSVCRCDAPSDDLNKEEDIQPHSHQRTEFFISIFDPGILWSDYGIWTDVVISLAFCLFQAMCSQSLLLQPFTESFPCADIHELLAPDILHQFVKGIFKDHLIEWINEYLVMTYGKAAREAIIDDIDRR